jgi:hypothetical protein
VTRARDLMAALGSAQVGLSTVGQSVFDAEAHRAVDIKSPEGGKIEPFHLRRFDLDPGLLEDLTSCGVTGGFADVLGAAGERPKAVVGAFMSSRRPSLRTATATATTRLLATGAFGSSQ